VLDHLTALPMVAVLDLGYGALLVAASVVIAGLSVSLVYRLFKGQD